MSKTIIQLFIVLLVSIEAFSQNQVFIIIDSTCLQAENDGFVLDGTFSLYGSVETPEYPYKENDRLIKKIEFKKEQHLRLEPMQYTLKYTPNDSTQKENSFSFYPQDQYIYLPCFFFNKSYPLLLRSMKNKDYIKFVSHYNGEMSMETMISVYGLTIVKKRGSYYALYAESVINEQGYLAMSQIKPIYKKKKVKLTKDFLKLSKKQLQTIEYFWANMGAYAFYDGLYLQTTIYNENGIFSFKTKDYISKLLWNELTQP